MTVDDEVQHLSQSSALGGNAVVRPLGVMVVSDAVSYYSFVKDHLDLRDKSKVFIIFLSCSLRSSIKNIIIIITNEAKSIPRLIQSRSKRPKYERQFSMN